MDFAQTLPQSLYAQATTLYPAHHAPPVTASAEQVQIDGRWAISLDASCGPLTCLAADDLRRRLAISFAQPLADSANVAEHLINVRVQPGTGRVEAYRLQVQARGVRIDAEDDEGAMRALFHLGWQMHNHGGPILDIGQWSRQPRWTWRITSPLLHNPHDTPQDYLDLPESYLLNMARYGYNATYLYADWFDYISPEVAAHLARPGWRERVDRLREAAAYLGRFGIRLCFHVNTLALPTDHPQFQAHPEMRGAQTWHEGLHCLCAGSPEVLALYQRAAQQLFTDVPDLAGAVLIVGGECFLHCYTRPFPKTEGTTNCSCCRQRTADAVIAELVNAFVQGARQGNPRAQVMVWPYSAFSWGDLATQQRMLEKLDKRVSSLITFEKDDWMQIDGISSYIFDYSSSQLGPSARFKALDGTAREQGLQRLARTETSNALEMFNVPRVPIMYRWAERFDRLRRQQLDGLHTAWRFYGFCAQRTDEIIDHFNWADDPDIDRLLVTLARRDFGASAAPTVVAAWRQFSDTFARFPYSGGTIGFPYFRGPFFIGPAHPFLFDLTQPLALSDRFWQVDPSIEEGVAEPGLINAQAQPKFFIDLIWTQPFGAQAMAERLSEMDRGWRAGLKTLKQAAPSDHRRLAWQEEFDIARVIGSMLRTAHHLVVFQQLREAITAQPTKREKLRSICRKAVGILNAEIANTESALEAVRRDPALGYGATYGRAFDEAMIQEKIEHTRHQIYHVLPRFFNNYNFHIFGEMAELSQRRR